MLSDANLAMYGVSPKALATALMSDPMVNSYAIFIAGEAAAEALKREMPVGHARACSSRVLFGSEPTPYLFLSTFNDRCMRRESASIISIVSIKLVMQIQPH